MTVADKMRNDFNNEKILMLQRIYQKNLDMKEMYDDEILEMFELVTDGEETLDDYKGLDLKRIQSEILELKENNEKIKEGEFHER